MRLCLRPKGSFPSRCTRCSWNISINHHVSEALGIRAGCLTQLRYPEVCHLSLCMPGSTSHFKLLKLTFRTVFFLAHAAVKNPGNKHLISFGIFWYNEACELNLTVRGWVGYLLSSYFLFCVRSPCPVLDSTPLSAHLCLISLGLVGLSS